MVTKTETKACGPLLGAHMSIAGGILTLAVMAIHRLRSKEGRPEVPYGVAIAIGGLAILAQRFLNQFA